VLGALGDPRPDRRRSRAAAPDPDEPRLERRARSSCV
jgi:hypothetical protein